MRIAFLALALGALALGIFLAGRHGTGPGRTAPEQAETRPTEATAPVRQTARILGTVLNERGEGASGAKVRAEDVAGNRFSADVAADGSYVLDDLGPGRYRVAAWTPGHWRPKPADVDAPAGGEARCDFVAHKGFSLRGRVKDTRDHAVEGIDIRPSFNEDQIAISDATGAFDLGGFESNFGTVDVVVHDPKARYMPWEGDVFEGVVIVLDDGAAIEGEVVRRETGAPVAGAKLRLREEKYFPQVVEATSARDGRFRIAGRPAGRAVLEAGAPGLSPSRVELEPRAGQTTHVRVELGAGGSVEVTAVDPEGRPVSGARVLEAEALSDLRNDPVPEARTGAGGRAVLGQLEPGRRRIAVASDDFLPAIASVEVPGDGMRASLAVALRRGGAIEGRMPAKPAMGQVMVMGRDTMFHRDVTPGADGMYRVAGLAAGDYYLICGFFVRVTVIEGETVRCDLEPGKGSGPFDFEGVKSAAPRPGNGRIRARVVGPDGFPVPFAFVAVIDASGAPVAQGFGDGIAVTVPQWPLFGIFPAPGLAPGEYDALAVIPRGGFALAKGVRVPDAGTADVSLAIGEGGVVEVTVADALTGVLAEGARVHVTMAQGRGVPAAVDPFQERGLFFYRRAAAAADARGVARIDGLSAGEYRGRAEAPDGRAAEFAFTIRDGETARVRAQLAR